MFGGHVKTFSEVVTQANMNAWQLLHALVDLFS